MSRRPFSLRRRLLAWLLVATALLGTVALIDTWREAVRMANALADRVLAGSALVIAERASLDENGKIAIDIPYGALEMLSSAAQDRVFYRVDGPPGHVVTGYPDLPVAVARQLGADVVIAVDVGGRPSSKPRTGLYEIILQSFEIMGRSLAQLEGKSANLLIQPKTDEFDSSDFSARKEMIEAGYLAGQKALPVLRQLLKLAT